MMKGVFCIPLLIYMMIQWTVHLLSTEDLFHFLVDASSMYATEEPGVEDTLSVPHPFHILICLRNC